MVDKQEQEIEAGIELLQSKRKDKNALNNIISFYRKNKAICQRAYNYNEEIEKNIKRFLTSPIHIKKKEVAKLIPDIVILVLTVNPIETNVFLHWLYDKQKTPSPLKHYTVEDSDFEMTIYHDPENEQKIIIHVSPFKTGENETRKILNRIRKIFKPTYLFMLGICYGLDFSKHSIGSVFISDTVQTFRINLRDDDSNSDETEFQAEREDTGQPDEKLIRKIRQFISYGQYQSIVSDDTLSWEGTSIMGMFLSCNSLISSHKVKQAIMTQWNSQPKPLGGEMEAGGVLKSYIVEEKHFSKWIIIKSICDWGEKKNLLSQNLNENKKIKDSLQAFAMSNTCGAFDSLLNIL